MLFITCSGVMSDTRNRLRVGGSGNSSLPASNRSFLVIAIVRSYSLYRS